MSLATAQYLERHSIGRYRNRRPPPTNHSRTDRYKHNTRPIVTGIWIFKYNKLLILSIFQINLCLKSEILNWWFFRYFKYILWPLILNSLNSMFAIFRKAERNFWQLRTFIFSFDRFRIKKIQGAGNFKVC